MSMVLELQCLMGIQCQDFTMLAADQNNTQGVFIIKSDEDKLIKLSDHIVLGASGDSGDAAQFSQFVAKNIQLYKMRNIYELETAAAAHFIRKNLSDALRTNPYMVNLLLAGYEEGTGNQLYYMDYLASCIKVPFAAHGFSGWACMGILDRYYNPNMTAAEAYNVVKICVAEVQRRVFYNMPNFQVVEVSKDGIKTWPNITSHSFGKHVTLCDPCART